MDLSSVPYDIMIDSVKEGLKDFKYLQDCSVLKTGYHVRYVKKTNNSRFFGGFFKKHVDGDIMELYCKGRKWRIYMDQNYIFYRKIERNPLRKMLQNILDNKFTITKSD